MSENPTYCLERAREHREAADETSLPNVRRTHLQAADTWERMAARNHVVSRLEPGASEGEAAR